MTQVITRIRPSVKNPARASIHVDGRYMAVLSHKQIESLGLKVGMPWDDNLADRVTQAAAYEKAMRAAMNRLNRRPMSRGQLRQKLIEKGHEPAVADRVLDKAVELGALDDENYARLLARELTLHGHAGPALVRARLRARHIPRDIIDRVVADNADHDTQQQQALRLARKKMRLMARLDPRTRQRRLWGALARRGYSHEVIDAVWRKLDDESADSSDDPMDGDVFPDPDLTP